ncbi:hypothetical protein [Streptomyces acidiscabies]|uniref:hypothetical protein n=1 Tax=Streptomyces acidiscabies TaxID=42234 RepID=UPI00095AE85E|nr:hypothetical protein [Streptomyces acidiscabies]GAV44124.1 hypothetical protein Saa2_07084 [Streptomyces acidiscabies]
MVSELMTNAIRHGKCPIQLRMILQFRAATAANGYLVHQFPPDDKRGARGNHRPGHLSTHGRFTSPPAFHAAASPTGSKPPVPSYYA